MDEPATDMRRGFEGYAARQGRNLDRDGMRYADPATNDAWHLWQAAVDWERSDSVKRLGKIVANLPR